MSYVCRNFLTQILLISFISLWAVGPAHASPQREWAFLAYDQAVLAHRMTKSACLVMLGVDADAHFDDVTQSSKRFLAQMNQLTIPPNTSGDPPANWQSIHSEITNLATFFDPMVRSAQQISAGDMHSIAVRILMTRNHMATEKFDALARKVPDLMSNQGLTNFLLLTMRQRVLSQQILRDFCFARVGFGGIDLRMNLVKNMTQFAAITELLIVGDEQKNIPKAPSIQIKLKLRTVQQKWTNFAGLVTAALEAEELTTGDIQIASVLGDSILNAINQVLAQFEKL